MADLEGLEPPTPWFEAKCSIQLSYRSSSLSCVTGIDALGSKFLQTLRDVWKSLAALNRFSISYFRAIRVFRGQFSGSLCLPC
jgi:hypothetical protein